MNKIISIILFSIIISACNEDENLSQEPVRCTIIVYPAADNDLYKEKHHTERKRQDEVSERLTPETVLPP